MATLTALYYPTIVIPDDEWLRQALLYWDRVASIVPPDQKELVDECEWLKPVLQADDVFCPMWLSDHPMDPRAFMDELQWKVEAPGYIDSLGPRNQWRFSGRLHEDKLLDYSDSFLCHHGLIDRSRRRGPWLPIESRTGMLYISLLAKHIADASPTEVASSTSSSAWYGRLYPVWTPGDQDAVASAEVLYENVLPVPATNVPLEKIMSFRDKRQDERVNFQIELRKYEKKVAAAQSTDEVKDVTSDFSKEAESGLANLRKALKTDLVDIAVSSFQALVSLEDPRVLTAAAVSAAVPAVPVVVSAGILGANAVIKITKVFHDERVRKNTALRDSAYAYLHYAEKEFGN